MRRPRQKKVKSEVFRSDKSGKKSCCSGYVVYVVGALVVAAALLTPWWTESYMNVHHTEPGRSSGDGKYVTYDEYIEQARRNGWTPVDPLEKLESVAIKYNQLFELHVQDSSSNHKDSHSSDDMRKMVEEEFKFVLNVLMYSKDKSTRLKAPMFSPLNDDKAEYIDLTPVLFEAIDGVHRGIVRAGKQLLQRGVLSRGEHVGSVVTRQQAEALTIKYHYNILFSLLRLVSQVATPNRLLNYNDTNSELVAFSHLFIDMERPLGRYKMGALGSVVSLGLYRVIEPLVMLGANCDEGMLASVRNGDDLALSMLLHLCYTETSTKQSMPRRTESLSDATVEQSLVLAKELKFPNLVLRLEKALSKSSANKDKAEPFHNDFLQAKMFGVESEIYDCTNTTKYSDGGYQKSNLVPENELGNQAPDQSSPVCDIDVFYAHSLNVSYLSKHYFSLGRPVIIRGLLDDVIAKGGWSVDALKRTDISKKVRPKIIPYSEQLMQTNWKNDIMSLKNYVDVMHNYSDVVRAWVSERDAAASRRNTKSCQALNPFGANDVTKQFLLQVGVPQYIFDNKILSSETPLGHLSEAPFPVCDGIVSDDSLGFCTTKKALDSMDGGLALLNSLIAAASMTTFSPKHGRPDTPQTFTRQFFMGPPLSGSPFHYHGPAFNALVYGRKLWFLLPPGKDLYSNIPPIEWASRFEDITSFTSEEATALYPYSSLESRNLPCSVHQKQGEVLFVPNMWSHQILNLEEAVGFATELHASEG